MGGAAIAEVKEKLKVGCTDVRGDNRNSLASEKRKNIIYNVFHIVFHEIT